MGEGREEQMSLVGRLQTLSLLKAEIMHYGPITLTFPITEEFLHYSHGRYEGQEVEDGN